MERCGKTEKHTEKQVDLACFCYKNPSAIRRGFWFFWGKTFDFCGRKYMLRLGMKAVFFGERLLRTYRSCFGKCAVGKVCFLEMKNR